MKTRFIIQTLLMLLFSLLLAPITGIHPIYFIAASIGLSVIFIGKGFAFVTLCGIIDANILVNCVDPIAGGTNDRLILINFDDLASVTKVNGIITAITMVVAKTGFVMQGKNNSVAPTQALVKQRFGEVYDHIINYKTFSLGDSVKVLLEKKVKGKFIAIIENQYKGTGGDSAFEMYGLDGGLIVTELTRDPNSSDTQGAYDITLASSEFAKEPRLPATIFLTDYAITKAIVDGIL